MAPSASPSSGQQTAKIVGLVVLGFIALCGLAGSCLFILSFFLYQP